MRKIENHSTERVKNLTSINERSEQEKKRHEKKISYRGTHRKLIFADVVQSKLILPHNNKIETFANDKRNFAENPMNYHRPFDYGLCNWHFSVSKDLLRSSDIFNLCLCLTRSLHSEAEPLEQEKQSTKISVVGLMTFSVRLAQKLNQNQIDNDRANGREKDRVKKEPTNWQLTGFQCVHCSNNIDWIWLWHIVIKRLIGVRRVMVIMCFR